MRFVVREGMVSAFIGDEVIAFLIVGHGITASAVVGGEGFWSLVGMG